MNFNKNKLINKVLDNYIKTWQYTLDSADFIDPSYLKKIDKYIYKNLMIKFKEIEIYDLLHLKDQGVELGLFDKLRIWFSGLEPIYRAEQEKLKKKQSQKNLLKE